MKAEKLLEQLVNEKAKSAIERNSQNLIDIMFEIALAIHSNQEGYFKGKDRRQVAAWVSDRLANLEYPTLPMGSSWGTLTTKAHRRQVLDEQKAEELWR